MAAGDPLMDGPRNPHDILDIRGEKALQKYLVDEIQEIYRLQGVNINEKHLDAISRQMMRWVRVAMRETCTGCGGYGLPVSAASYAALVMRAMTESRVVSSLPVESVMKTAIASFFPLGISIRPMSFHALVRPFSVSDVPALCSTTVP